MEILARVRNRTGSHEVEVDTGGQRRTVPLPAKDAGRGSALNGGELLFLSLATCYCNDVFREARPGGIQIEDIEVLVEGRVAGRGEPAQRIVYSVRARTPDDPARVEALLWATDKVAEIQNTLRLGMPVTLESVVVEPTAG